MSRLARRSVNLGARVANRLLQRGFRRGLRPSWRWYLGRQHVQMPRRGGDFATNCSRLSVVRPLRASRRQADTALVVVHEFRTENLHGENLTANTEDLQAFVSVLLHVPASDVVQGQLYGPAVLAPGAHLDRKVDVFIGKVVFDWHAIGQLSSHRGAATCEP
jgi:hypothetical protein